jgi:hypothetical protein
MNTEGWNLLPRDLVEDLYKALVNQRTNSPAIQAGPSRKRARH